MNREDIHIISAKERLSILQDTAIVVREYGAVLYEKYYVTYTIAYFLQVKTDSNSITRDVTDLYHPLRFPVSLN